MPIINITKEYLLKCYSKDGMPMKEIAEISGCGETWIHTLIHRYRIPVRERRLLLKGRTFSKEHKTNLSQAKRGKKIGAANPNWKGGVSQKNLLARLNRDYVFWRRAALRSKGGYCGFCGKDLNIRCPQCGHRPDKHVHHIRPFAINPDLRFHVENATVLCDSCHLSQHKKRRLN